MEATRLPSLQACTDAGLLEASQSDDETETGGVNCHARRIVTQQLTLQQVADLVFE